jgi:hypothetical protein
MITHINAKENSINSNLEKIKKAWVHTFNEADTNTFRTSVLITDGNGASNIFVTLEHIDKSQVEGVIIPSYRFTLRFTEPEIKFGFYRHFKFKDLSVSIVEHSLVVSYHGCMLGSPDLLPEGFRDIFVALLEGIKADTLVKETLYRVRVNKVEIATYANELPEEILSVINKEVYPCT